MTEDDDRVAYLAGEEGFDIDELSRADLDDLKALLADDALWAEPPAGLEDDVVAAIAAEAARRPVRPDGPTPAATPPDRVPARPAVTSLAARRVRRMRVAIGAAAAVVAIAAAGIVVTRGGSSSGTDVALEADSIPGASGSANLRRTDSGWRIELDASGLPRRDGGEFYEAWLRNPGGVLVSIGTFNEGADVVLWAGVSPREFPTLTVTAEEADGDPSSSGVRVLVGTIVLP
jgi:anti-sigma-K factor RskA